MKKVKIFLLTFLSVLYLLNFPSISFAQNSLIIYNNSFENDTSNWWFWNPSNGQWSIVTDEKINGNKSVKITLGNNASNACGNNSICSCINQGRQQNQNPSFWEPNNFLGKTIVFSFWYKTEDNNTLPTFQIAKRDNNGNYTYWWYPDGILQTSSTNNQWKLAYKAITFPSSNISAFDISFCVSGTPGKSVWIDNVLTYLPKHYSAIIIGEKSLAVDYSYSDGNRVAAFLNKGHSIESADTTIFLPRVLKGAYKKNDNDPGFNSGIVIMNTENEQATVTLKIYKKDGSRLLKEYNFTLPPFGFKGIWPPSYADWPIEETDPPAVITSNKKVVVSVDLRHDNLDPQNTANIEGSLRGSAYEGIPQKYTSTTWYIPIIVRNAYNEGWESRIIIQNTENQQANLSISLYGIDNDYQKICSNILLPPKSQRIIYFPSSSYCECFTELISNSNYNNNKKFSAKISSNKKIAVVFSHSSSSKRKSIEENAIPQELIDSKIFIPRVYNNYSGWISSFTIQNTSNLQNNNIKIKYIKNNGVSEEGSGSCFLNQIFPLKSIVVFAPNCIGEGNFYSAVIESTNNLPLAGIYHLAYPKNPPSPENLNVYRSAGSTAFSQKETSRVFFIPRIYFYSWNWQTGLQIQNAVDENNQFDLYILSENGKILVEKRNISLSDYQAKSYYLPNDFSFELAQEPPEGNYPSLPSISPTNTPTPTHTPTPASTLTPACAKKTLGDANCDEEINENDYNIWKCEFLGNGRCNNSSSNLSASFNLDEKVDLIDFEIWRKNRFTTSPTLTNTLPTNPPASPQPTNTPTPTPTPTLTPTPISGGGSCTSNDNCPNDKACISGQCQTPSCYCRLEPLYSLCDPDCLNKVEFFNHQCVIKEYQPQDYSCKKKIGNMTIEGQCDGFGHCVIANNPCENCNIGNCPDACRSIE